MSRTGDRGYHVVDDGLEVQHKLWMGLLPVILCFEGFGFPGFWWGFVPFYDERQLFLTFQTSKGSFWTVLIMECFPCGIF